MTKSFDGSEHNTPEPCQHKIIIKIRKRADVPEGIYWVKCVGVDNPYPHPKWGKWFVKAHFEIHGARVTKFIRCGDVRNQPEIGPDTWLGRRLEVYGGDVTAMLDNWFQVEITRDDNGVCKVGEMLQWANKQQRERLEKTA